MVGDKHGNCVCDCKDNRQPEAGFTTLACSKHLISKVLHDDQLTHDDYIGELVYQQQLDGAPPDYGVEEDVPSELTEHIET